MDSVKLKSGNNKQELKEVNFLDMIPTDGETRDAIVQNILCENRKSYMPVQINANYETYYLEFIPNYLNRDSDYFDMYGEIKIKPYSFNVNLIEGTSRRGNLGKRHHILEIHCFGNNNRFTFNDDNEPEVKSKKQTTYVFNDGTEIVTEKYFTLNKADEEYLIKHFPEKYVMIGSINHYLTNTITSSYNELTEYDHAYFLDLEKLLDVEIDEQYAHIVKPLINSQKVYHERYTVPSFGDFVNNNRLYTYDSFRPSNSDRITAMGSAMSHYIDSDFIDSATIEEFKKYASYIIPAVPKQDTMQDKLKRFMSNADDINKTDESEE